MPDELPRQIEPAPNSTGTTLPSQDQQSHQGTTLEQPTNSAPSHITQDERWSDVGGSPDVSSSSHSQPQQTTSSTTRRRAYPHRNYWAGRSYQQRNVPDRGSASHGGRSSHRSSHPHSRSGHRGGGNSGRSSRRARDDFLDSYDGYDNFMLSFGLKPWDCDDIDMGENIIEECTSDRD